MTTTLADEAPATVDAHAEAERLRTLISRARQDADAATARRATMRVSAGEAVASRSRRHNWCDEARRAVEEAGCVWPEPDAYCMDVTVTYRLRATASEDVTRDRIDSSFVHASLRPIPELELDEDWTDVECETVTVEVDEPDKL